MQGKAAYLLWKTWPKEIKRERTTMVQAPGDGTDDPGAISLCISPVLPHLDQTWQHKLKPHVLIASVLSLIISDICFLRFL